MKPLLSVILIYYNTPLELQKCLDSLPQSIGPAIAYEIIIVDNKSPKPIPTTIKWGLTILKNPENKGYGRAINQAAKIAKGKYFLILNPDTVCSKNSIKLMVEKMESEPKIGVLGPQLIDKKGKVIHSIGSLPKLPDALFVFSPLNKIWPNNPFSKKYWGRGIDRTKEQETDVVGGAAMVIPKKIFLKVRGFDERFFMYFEEVDICIRIKKLGYKVLYSPEAKIIHLVGKSNSDKKWIRNEFEKSRYKFFQKYYGTPIALLSEIFLRIF